MKKLLLLLASVYLFFSCDKSKNFTVDNILFTSEKLAKSKPNSFEFCVDTVTLKKALEQRVLMNKSTLDKIEIRKQKVVSTNDEYYFLLARNFKSRLKLALWLDKKDDVLYLHHAPKSKGEEAFNNEVFYFTYLTCEGTDTDCFPEVCLQNGEKFWTSAKMPKCGESKCKTAKTVLEE